MPFCPKCGYEYKPIIEICPDCGRKLILKLKKPKEEKVEKEVAENFDPDEEPKLKLLYVTKSMICANFLKETLGRSRIPCLIKSESGYYMRIGALIRHPLSDIRVYVREEDFEKSCEIKEQIVDSL